MPDEDHTRDKIASKIVLEHGADTFLTVKDNLPTFRKNLQAWVDERPGPFF